ncbi:reverse transcriptase (rna-dependent dna polymerase) [Holotrichia oblita]|uniref:Reverse transcriptase (Rna-dependent dna polymerase) n=1 Tax=Holotrichia oblita TaxID=644536 RepID=A0ACB9SYN9_HOLOL|nr:reverse transcriptase (rna-dependent dna polymerase) [Holotrichia oblita]
MLASEVQEIVFMLTELNKDAMLSTGEVNQWIVEDQSTQDNNSESVDDYQENEVENGNRKIWASYGNKVSIADISTLLRLKKFAFQEFKRIYSPNNRLFSTINEKE